MLTQDRWFHPRLALSILRLLIPHLVVRPPPHRWRDKPLRTLSCSRLRRYHQPPDRLVVRRNWLERDATAFASEAEEDTGDGGDADDLDLVSIDSSSNMGPWPAFLPRPLSQHPTRLGTVGTPSTSSLRSTYSLDPHAISAKQERQGASVTFSRCNRSSVGGELGGDGATRNSFSIPC
ncbi:unnamed protein product [Schistocephalus solidus]|uniref:Uncharacterized protein n=1 Tax=Schistocephalus solidus TaxID=70667 RepID=A0A183S9Y7_SCHSO|nr:unnamed protein product [Schistocephalus solidus]